MAAVRIISQAPRKYLLWCANEHIEFRIPELMSIASMYKIPIKWIDKPIDDPYVIVEMGCEKDAKKLTSRSLLVRSCYELWGDGDTEARLHNNVQCYPQELMKPHLGPGKTFKVRVETFNKTLQNAEKLRKIESFSYLPFEGNVNLKNADTILHLIEYYGLSPMEIPDTPYKSFFGRWITDGQRELISKYSLKKRTYIGSTSMDAQLSFIMANCAQVQPGNVVVDPFVGTGSILVSAAHYGACVWGWDIDYLTLHARTKPTRHSQKQRAAGESIANNFKQYGLEHSYMDVVVMDNARHFWRNVHYVDAIITDPPYGIRESTECIGTLKESQGCDKEPRQQPSGSSHFPSKITYSLSNVYCDLINFAVTHLVVGGRLVFWLPVIREDYDESQIPSHPCLQLLFNCEQVLTVHSSRRLITLIKNRHPQEGELANVRITDITAKFREKFFQASLMTKAERASMKSKCPRDKRGQGLSYRVKETYVKKKVIKMEGANGDVELHSSKGSDADTATPVTVTKVNGKASPIENHHESAATLNLHR